MRLSRPLALPTTIVSCVLSAFLIFAGVSDHRNTYGNALWIGSMFGVSEISGEVLAIFCIAVVLLPLPYLVFHAVRLTHFGQHTREYTSRTAALHPIGAFLFLFEMTFSNPENETNKKDIFLTRLLLLYLFLGLVFSMWLGFPYKQKG